MAYKHIQLLLLHLWYLVHNKRKQGCSHTKKRENVAIRKPGRQASEKTLGVLASRTERMNFCGLKFLEICYSSNRKLILMGFPYGEIYFPRSMVFKQLFQGLDPSVQLGHYWESK